MSISSIRSILYKAAKYLGDVSAVRRAARSGSADPIIKRIARRIYGKIAGRGFRFFK